MKKVTHTTQQQARRQRALNRFSINRDRLHDTEYVARKEQELAALKSALGA